jgi:hypothetical protein
MKSFFNKKKSFSLKILLPLVFFLIFIKIFIYFFFTPQQTPSYYYSLLKRQENILSTTTITDKDHVFIDACVKKNKNQNGGLSENQCLRQFYQKYTITNGVEEAFSHLALLQLEYPKKFSGGCHYISHGIGHGAVILNHGNVYKAFNIMESSNFFKNIITCGNGYYHGVIEEATKGKDNKEDFIKTVISICENKETPAVGKEYCYHGVGHAAVAEFGDIKDALSICDSVGNNYNKKFSCHSGVFMEVSQFSDVVIKDKQAFFPLCDSFERPYRQACYFEDSAIMNNRLSNPGDYKNNILFCKKISSNLDRMACVKLFAIRAVRVAQYEDIKSMCNNTSNSNEKTICSAIVAYRIAGSIDKTRSQVIYNQAINDVCNIFDPITSLKCKNIIVTSPAKLYVTADTDLKNLDNIKIYGLVIIYLAAVFLLLVFLFS